MSKFIPMDLLKSLRGKVCMHSDTYFANRYGTNYTGKICNPYTGAPSAEQIAKREKFAQARAAMAALTPEQIAAYKIAFKAQRKYKSLQGYIFAQEYAKLA